MCETRKLPQTVYESKKTEAMSSRIVKWLAEKEKTIVYFPYAQNAFDASRGVRGFAGIKTDPNITLRLLSQDRRACLQKRMLLLIKKMSH